MWINIHAGWYDFEQRFRDAELVKQLSKSDITSFFHTYFFDTPARRIRRLSVHLDSQRLTPEQCAALGPVLHEMQIEVDREQLAQLAASRPTVEQAKAFAEQFLRAQGRGDDDVQKVVDEIEKLGRPKDLDGYKVIEDREQWRSQQERAPHAHPVAEVRRRCSFSSSAADNALTGLSSSRRAVL